MIATMSENKQTSDSELLLQIVGYNSEAFVQLYNRYSATIYSLIKEIVSSPKLSEKILINVFSVFLKRIDHYSTNSNNIFTFLTLLARNISIDKVKRMKFGEEMPAYSDEYEIEFILPNLSQEIHVINLDDRNILGEKIKLYKNHLTEVQNLVLSLIYFEGLEEEEIAKRLNVTAAVVRQKILGIMESLHSQFTGKAEQSTSNKEILNLVKLESLGCLSLDERKKLNQSRNDNPDFLWKELGEYQNLTALLSTTITLAKPERDLNTELNSAFTNILQGGIVDHPVVTPDRTNEISSKEPESSLIQEPVKQIAQETIQHQTIPNPLPEVSKQPVVPEKKKPEFELKFRERDPKELSILKKHETAGSSLQTPAAYTRTSSDVKLKDYNPGRQKTNVLVDKKEESVTDKKTLPAEAKVESAPHQKTPADTIKTDLQIKNDDPSILIEESKPVIAKEEVVVKNRLIPNSSINLKELFKKEERPVVNKLITPVRSIDEKKILEKPVAPIVDKSDIKIKTNEPPKEFRSSVFVDKNEKSLLNKPAAPAAVKNEAVNKANDLTKEIQKSTAVAGREENKVEDKQLTPAEEKSDIKIKTNVPPKDFRNSNIFVDKGQKISPTRPVATVQAKPVAEIKKNEPVKKDIISSTLEPKNEKLAETKTPAVEANPNMKAEVPEKVITESKKEENLFERIKPANDRSNLKIRETVFNENDKKPEVLRSETNTVVPEKKSVTEKALPINTVTESINVDEILNKIEDDKSEPVLSEAESYEKEIIRLRKRLRRNILVSAALFVILAASSIFVYLKFQESPVKTENKTTVTEKKNLVDQSNFAFDQSANTLNQEANLQIDGENNTLTAETIVPEKSITNPKVVTPTLPEIVTKEESTLFASNINSSLTDNEKETNQIAAAKTEKIIPPKENKVIEEEPAFFVAVEEMPELIGGIKGLQSKIVYPEIARRVGVEGKVIVQAVVDESGNVISVNTIKGIGSGCDEVAMDAVRNAKFTPGKQRGKTVKTQVTIPIVFKK